MWADFSKFEVMGRRIRTWIYPVASETSKENLSYFGDIAKIRVANSQLFFGYLIIESIHNAGRVIQGITWFFVSKVVSIQGLAGPNSYATMHLTG